MSKKLYAMNNLTDNTQPDHTEEVLEMVTDTNQASEDKLRPFTSLFQNAAVARDYVPGCMSEEDINELAAHILFIEPTYKYDISKAPIDNVFSAYRIAVKALIRTEKLKLLAEAKVLIKAGGYEASYEISMIEKLEAEL